MPRACRSVLFAWPAVAIALLTFGASPASQEASDPAAVSIAITPDHVRLGDVFLIDVVCPCEATSGTVRSPLLPDPVPLFREAGSETWRAILGVDLDRRPGPYAVTVALDIPGQAALAASRSVEVADRAFTTRRLRVAPDFVNPPPAVERRIADEAVRLRELYARTTDRGPVGPMQPPVATTVNSNFGTRSIFNDQPRSPHAGVDFRGAVGTPVTAPGAAVVALAGDLYFTGRTVILDHGQGLVSILAHLSEIAVSEGATVERGDPIGAVGATGRVTGPHLHWSVRLHGARVDPLSVLKVLQTG